MMVQLRHAAFCLLWSVATPILARAQPPAVPSAAQKPETPPAFTLSLNPQRLVTLVAREAKASDIAVVLARELKTPVHMSPLVARQVVTLKLSKAPVEDLLHALAPQVYVDYEIRWDRPQEDWVAVELTGFNEREPVTPVEPKAFMVLAGSTEDESVTEETLAQEQAAKDEEKLKKDPPKEGPVLDVSVQNGLVSIRARKQMVAAVLLDVASKAGMGFETRGQLDEAFIDLDVRSVPVDQLPAVVARPGFGVLMRRDLTAGTTRAVAVLLGTEATKVKR